MVLAPSDSLCGLIVSNTGLPDGNLSNTAGQGDIWHCHSRDIGVPDWAVSVLCDETKGAVDPTSVMAQLAQRGITRVFCEGGGSLAASLLRAGLVDDLVMFQAGCVIGREVNGGNG